MILELLVSTTGTKTGPHIAPMGIVVGDSFCWDSSSQVIEFSPFVPSVTLDNLQENPSGLLLLTDDLTPVVRCLLKYFDGQPIRDYLETHELRKLAENQDLVPIPEGNSDRFFGLRSTCQALKFQTVRFQPQGPRVLVKGQTEGFYQLRPFLGFNRAKHAIFETVIQATRFQMIPKEVIDQTIQQWDDIVMKTGGKQEIDLWNFVTFWVQAAYQSVR